MPSVYSDYEISSDERMIGKVDLSLDKNMISENKYASHCSLDSTEKTHNYECLSCAINFLNFSEFRTHNSSVHLSCSLCHSIVFTTKKSLLQHERDMHREKKIKCHICLKMFTIQSKLERHMKMHNHKCDLCDSIFESFAKLMSHRRDAHDLAISSSKKNESSIFSTNDSSDDSYCSIKKELMDELTPTMRSLTCSLCPGKVFSKKKLLLSHKSVVHGEKKLQCYLCTKRFAFQSQLDRHEQHHYQACDLCKDVFDNHVKLQRHRREVHHIKSAPSRITTFTCPTCQTKFNNRNHMDEHILSKHSNLVFECDICKNTYKHRRNLKDHIKRNHTEASRFECTICNITFAFKKTLQSHIKRCHEKPDLITEEPTIVMKLESDDYSASDNSVLEMMVTNKEWKRKYDVD